jgi:hypothetical protein
LLDGGSARVEVLAYPGLGQHDVGVEGVLGQLVVLGEVLAVGRAAEGTVPVRVGGVDVVADELGGYVESEAASSGRLIFCPVARKSARCQLIRPVCWFCQ